MKISDNLSEIGKKEILKHIHLSICSNTISRVFFPGIDGDYIFDPPEEHGTDKDYIINFYTNAFAYYGYKITPDQAYFACLLNSMWVSRNIDGSQSMFDLDPDILVGYIKNSRIFRRGELEENPYYKNIRFNGFSQIGKSWEIKQCHFSKNEFVAYDAGFYDPKTRMYLNKLALFDYQFDYPVIAENNEVWMSISPTEIFSQDPAIKTCEGNVLTLGCGMGYFAYMVSRKANVSSVTIVEKSEDVVRFFNEIILPQFEHKEKIKIINADAIEYMKHMTDGIYDYCFADLWKSCSDVDLYLKTHALAQRFHHTKVLYWIEEAMQEQLWSHFCLIAYRALGMFNDESVNYKDLLQQLSGHEKQMFSLSLEIRRLLEDVFSDCEVAIYADIKKVFNMRFIMEVLDRYFMSIL